MKKLETMTAEQLQSAPYSPVPFLVDELLPEGLHILAGAPKIGKSWLALWLCLCVSQGQPLWNFAVTQGEVLYLSLEDSYRRIQSRLFDLTDDAPQTLHFAILADTLKHGLEQQIEQFLTEHPNTKLVVIDTLQRVRSAGSDSNLYANDYQEIGLLKKLADKRHIAIRLIHHLRKLHDALQQYAELKSQSAEFDSDKLQDARLALRPEMERSAVDCVQSAYGDRYQPLMMYDSKRDVANLLHEEAETRSIRERLRQKQQQQPQQKQNKKKSRDTLER